MSHGQGMPLEVARIQTEINRLFDALERLQRGEGSGSWSPPVDVREGESGVIVEFDLPGVEPESLELLAESGSLVLRGVRVPPAARLEAGARVLVDEFAYGPFERVVPVGAAVNTRAARARLVGGVLTIEFPRVSNRRGEAVPITIG